MPILSVCRWVSATLLLIGLLTAPTLGVRGKRDSGLKHKHLDAHTQDYKDTHAGNLSHDQKHRHKGLRLHVNGSADTIPMAMQGYVENEDMGEAARTPQENAARKAWRDEHSKQVPALTFKGIVMAMGGGTGVFMDGYSFPTLKRDIILRTRIQNDMVMILILSAYFIGLATSLGFLYWRVRNDSPVSYYADPRFQNLALEGDDPQAFLEVFNQAPKHTYLQVTGYTPPPRLAHESEWEFDEPDRVAFSFSLDLATWVVRQPLENDGDDVAHRGIAEVGVCDEDLETLAGFLAADTNDLAILEVNKVVSWPGWEDLATNIKHRIRQCGFEGTVTIHCSDGEKVDVYKNKRWANFCHNRSTSVLCALSLFGWMFHTVYMKLRCTKTPIVARHYVDISTADYWRLIADQLCAEGFGTQQETDSRNAPAPSTAQQTESMPAAAM